MGYPIAASEEPDLPYSCGLFEVSEDRSRLVPEEGESRHGLAIWVALLVKHFLEPSGHVLNGEVSWSADDSGIMKWPTSAVCFGPPLDRANS
jgi:hypothetical protein